MGRQQKFGDVHGGCRAGRTCWDIALDHMKTYCDTFCSPEGIKRLNEQIERLERSEEKECSKKCDDPSAWLSNQTDPYILDPHLCQDSCQNSSLHCKACSNEKYRQCLVNNETVCYHPDLWCDGHPACDNAEDEPITDPTCYQTLLRRGDISFFALETSDFSEAQIYSFHYSLGSITPKASFSCRSRMYPGRFSYLYRQASLGIS